MFKTLRAQLLIWVIFIETAILLTAGVLQYQQKKTTELADLTRQCEMVTIRLNGILPAALYNYDDEQVSRVLNAEMENLNITQILVQTKKKLHGFIRDENWAVKPAKQSDEASATVKLKLIYDQGRGQEEMGDLMIYTTQKFIDAALKKELFNTFLVIMILDFCILILLSIILGKKVVIPMRAIADTMLVVAKTRNAGIRLKPGTTEEINAAVNSINELLEANQQAARVAERLGEGDLTVRAEPVSDEDTMGLAQKRMLSSLTELISEIAMVSESLSDGAEGVSSASEALSEQTTGEATSVQEISGSLSEIASRAKSNAENSEAMRVLSTEAKNAATTGNEQMKQMVQAMNEINAASQQIAKVIKVIDDIAFQTNLLALNAAVEAARAGRHGKGFAVVADEVRNLAGRSAKAARETGELIESTVKKVKTGADVAIKTNAGLQIIVDTVIKTSDLIEDNVAASKEQAAGVEQISTGLVSIESATQKNCATSEETASAAQELSQLAHQLRELLSRFKLREER